MSIRRIKREKQDVINTHQKENASEAVTSEASISKTPVSNKESDNDLS